MMLCRSVVTTLALCSVMCGVSNAQETLTGVRLPQYDDPVALPSTINSAADEYGATMDPVRERMLFTSERTGTASQWAADLKLAQVQSVLGTFNAEGSQRAFVTMSAVGEAVGVAFVAGARQSFPALVSVTCDGADLHLGPAITETAGEWFTSQPAMSPDGQYLVFVSDRDGGAGGLDLWMCQRVSPTEWSAPYHLSGSINAAGDEITPRFLSADSLVYASNSYGGKGGTDIFLTVMRDGAWQEPEPIVAMNTEYNDSDAMQLPDGSWLFASDRPGGAGGFDLWIARRRP